MEVDGRVLAWPMSLLHISEVWELHLAFDAPGPKGDILMGRVDQ